jgi:hypothetical protein
MRNEKTSLMAMLTKVCLKQGIVNKNIIIKINMKIIIYKRFDDGTLRLYTTFLNSVNHHVLCRILVKVTEWYLKKTERSMRGTFLTIWTPGAETVSILGSQVPS